LLSDEEKNVTKFLLGKSELIWNESWGYDFAFLDYFSDNGLEVSYIEGEINKCVEKMKTNGIITIHDAYVKKYPNISLAMKRIAENRKDVECTTIPFNYGLGIIRYMGRCEYYSCKKEK
jgi:hypothetical protein